MTLPKATRIPSARTSPSILMMPPIRAATWSRRLEQLIRSRTPWKLEGPECSDAQEAATGALAVVAGRRESASLGEQFHKDDCRHDGVTGEVPLKYQSSGCATRNPLADCPGTRSAISSTNRMGGRCGSRSTP